MNRLRPYLETNGTSCSIEMCDYEEGEYVEYDEVVDLVIDILYAYMESSKESFSKEEIEDFALSLVDSGISEWPFDEE